MIADKLTDKATNKGKVLFPHNKRAFNIIVDAIANHKNAAICQPMDTGVKFAILEMTRIANENDSNMRFLYITNTMFGYYQIESASIKSDIDISNISFITYADIAELSAKEQRDLIKDAACIYLTDYLTIQAAYQKKVEDFVSRVNTKKTSIIGTTNIRSFLLWNEPELVQKHNALLGDGTTATDVFDIKVACCYGNYEFPIYHYCDIAQNNRIKQFCAEVKETDPSGLYSNYQTRAKYYSATKAEQMEYLKTVLAGVKGSKYLVISKSESCFKKDAALLDELIHFQTHDMPEPEILFYAGEPEKESIIDRFKLMEHHSGRCFLFTTLESILDTKLDGAAATILMYKTTTPSQVYQLFNAAMACGKRRNANPVIIDLYNNNASVAYSSPNIKAEPNSNQMTFLYGEMGISEQEKKLYKKGDVIPLPYYEYPFQNTEDLNRVLRDYANKRVANNDLLYLQELMNQCDKAGKPITPASPFSLNGINLLDWYAKLRKTNSGKYTPRTITAEEASSILNRLKPIYEEMEKENN